MLGLGERQILFFELQCRLLCMGTLVAINIVEVLEYDMAFQGPAQNCERQLFNSSCLSVSPSARNNSAFTGEIFVKLDFRVVFENISIRIEFC
jgi:hypothetical protein